MDTKDVNITEMEPEVVEAEIVEFDDFEPVDDEPVDFNKGLLAVGVVVGAGAVVGGKYLVKLTKKCYKKLKERREIRKKAKELLSANKKKSESEKEVNEKET